MDPGKMDERIDKMAERLMRELDGSPEQRAQVSSIAKAAARDMAPIAEQARSARKQAVELLKASTIDKAAVEALRAQQLNLADTASRRATQAMTEIAEVLTPEQRAKAARWMESRAERRRG
jgi:Spy/CpxP family protein refolding chaperone